MVLLFIVEAVSASRTANVMLIGRVTVDQFALRLIIVSQEPMGAAVDLLYRLFACKIYPHLWIPVDADTVPGSGLALHDGVKLSLVQGWSWREGGSSYQETTFMTLSRRVFYMLVDLDDSAIAELMIAGTELAGEYSTSTAVVSLEEFPILIGKAVSGAKSILEG